MDEDIVATILDLYHKKDWKAIVDTYRDHPDRNKVLWVYPTEENFNFIGKCMRDLKCNEILSIGCGSGLLEWMIKEVTGIQVSGVEVDGVWWQCKYAPPTFIPLLITQPTLDKDMISLLQKCQNAALLFCYFNNRDAFNEYLKYFTGGTLIIIGPSGDKYVHTDPKPFGDLGAEWSLYRSQEVGQTKDYIAVYTRKEVVT
ncbi:uncharacterized protein LOC121740306 [Aricia agestis]|uniref:uncharacterized protein LOC121740306 n=1 Tax=Aricia agestis TaxID=91739 RepID=UPI001C2023D1|nr:uncharacterized protein LOC121740306 [Aricia agestis]